MSSLSEMDEVWLEFNKQHVLFSKDEMDENTDIAVDFLEQFVGFARLLNLEFELVKQGSSFESLKVDRPDEYDFLLVLAGLDAHIPTDPLHPLLIESRNIKKETCLMNCYHPVLLRGNGADDMIYDCIKDTWPRMSEHYEVLSARGSISFLHQLLIIFEKFILGGNYKIEGVARIDPPKRGNPALTTVLHKHDGTKIAIDTSPALRLYCEETQQFKHYIAKKKPRLENFNDDRFRLLWLDCHSREEKKVIAGKKSYERRNYRIVKSALSSVVKNNYIWKTIFMLRDDPFPASPSKFMVEMLTRFQSFLQAELKHRGHDVGDCSIAEGGRLKTKFNKCENILARYEVKQLKNWYAIITKKLDLYIQGEFIEFTVSILGRKRFNCIYKAITNGSHGVVRFRKVETKRVSSQQEPVKSRMCSIM